MTNLALVQDRSTELANALAAAETAIRALPADAQFNEIIAAAREHHERRIALFEATAAAPPSDPPADEEGAYTEDGAFYPFTWTDFDPPITAYRSSLSSEGWLYEHARCYNRALPANIRATRRATDEPHRWAFFEDISERWRVPISFADPGGLTRSMSDEPPQNVRAWAEQWRESHRSLHGRELVAYLRPGKAPIFALWFDKPIMLADARRFARDELNPTHAAEPRFLASPDPCDLSCGPEADYDPYRVFLPAEDLAPSALATLAGRKAAAPTVEGPTLRTGLVALDNQFRADVRGLPIKARVVVAAPTENAKTTTAIHFAEQAREAGWFVVVVAIDEEPELIERRLTQRRGAALAPDGFYVVPLEAGDTFSSLACMAHTEAAGRPVMFVLDSVQTFAIRTFGELGERERISALFEDMKAAQEKYPCVVVMTSEVARGSGATKGSGSIDFGATLDLRVKLTGDRLDVTIAKNRYGSKKPFALTLDRARQRLVSSDAAQAIPAAGGLSARVVAAVRELGEGASGAAVEDRVGGDNKATRDALRTLVSAGDLNKSGAGRATRYSVKRSTE